MIEEEHEIIEIVEYKNPLSGYAKGVKIRMNGRVIITSFDPSFSDEYLKQIWDNREGYNYGGKARIVFYSEDRIWGHVQTLSYKDGYTQITPKFDKRDVRKVFENINQIIR